MSAAPVDVAGLMEAGFMESGPSAIHVRILASPLRGEAPAAEPMALENEVFCIDETDAQDLFHRTSGFDRVEVRADPKLNRPPIRFQLVRRVLGPC
ncbi:hypothetical protein J7418_18215 [Xanthomonas phaseoli pv. dieffenbachiae]|nr:hypothetical protein [Xanthomonas phaseoli]MBO9777591.1 hypothetical protein [Xanthomonas phaseoli pv. dieffenbachiae]MBO9817236.1 hypothetical protein [Xanthomonas phaseoli pv. dieffenbachiae]MBO9859616.1 hypothetical protein [Xanthomonas phaseoli pv. dieffenbachiae]MBO9945103.1 hypothetical protein [Xanthomonas phaseoli pv. dieffenbachiae]MBO9974447.1 hypothetical protein [Xanthomonas phaseoli pv. dieffenbachiae]